MMKAIIAIIMAVVAAMSAPSFAQSVNRNIPVHLNVFNVTVGALIEKTNVVSISHEGQTVSGPLSLCQVSWNAGDRFYFLVSEKHAVLIRKDIFDYVWREGLSWDDTINVLFATNQVCKFGK